jgi:hypothetical protein
MTREAKCPFCGSRRSFPAQFVAEGVSVSCPLLRFSAIEKFPWWKYAGLGDNDALRDVAVEHPTACLECGMLWAKYDLAKTLELVQRHGSPEIKATLSMANY